MPYIERDFIDLTSEDFEKGVKYVSKGIHIVPLYYMAKYLLKKSGITYFTDNVQSRLTRWLINNNYCPYVSDCKYRNICIPEICLKRKFDCNSNCDEKNSNCNLNNCPRDKSFVDDLPSVFYFEGIFLGPKIHNYINKNDTLNLFDYYIHESKNNNSNQIAKICVPKEKNDLIKVLCRGLKLNGKDELSIESITSQQRASSFNFAQGGIKYHFELQNDSDDFPHIYYNSSYFEDGIKKTIEKNILMDEFFTFNSSNPLGKLSTFKKNQIKIGKITADNNRIFAYGKDENGKGKNRFFWAQMTNEFPAEKGGINLPGVYVRKSLTPKDIDLNWSIVWELAKSSYKNHPTWFMFNKELFLEKNVLPCIHHIMYHYILQGWNKFFASIPIIGEIGLKSRILDGLLKSFFIDNCPIIVDKRIWYEIMPEAPSDMPDPDNEIKEILIEYYNQNKSEINSLIASAVREDQVGQVLTYHLLMNTNVNLLKNFANIPENNNQSNEYNFKIDNIEIIDIAVANPHRYEHYKKTIGGELQAFIYPIEIEKNKPLDIDKLIRYLTTICETLDKKLLNKIKKVIDSTPNLKINDGNAFNDGTCNFYILGKVNNKYSVLWLDEQEYYSEKWRLIDPKDRNFTGPMGNTLSVFPIISRMNQPFIINEEFYNIMDLVFQNHKEEFNTILMHKLAKTLNTDINFEDEPFNGMFKINVFHEYVEASKNTILEALLNVFFIRSISNPNITLQLLKNLFFDTLSDLTLNITQYNLKDIPSFNKIKEYVSNQKKLIEKYKIDITEFENNFDAPFDKLDKNSRLAVSRYAVVVSSLDEIFSISYMWGTTDRKWRKRIYPGVILKNGKDGGYFYDTQSLNIRDDMTLYLSGSFIDSNYNVRFGYWYQKYLPYNNEYKDVINHSWNFVTKKAFEIMDQFYLFGVYDDNKFRDNYQYRGIDERNHFFWITFSNEKVAEEFIEENHEIWLPTRDMSKDFSITDWWRVINPVFKDYGAEKRIEIKIKYDHLLTAFFAYYAHPRDDDIAIFMNDKDKEKYDRLGNLSGRWQKESNENIKTGISFELDYIDFSPPEVKIVKIQKDKNGLSLTIEDFSYDIRYYSIGAIDINTKQPIIIVKKAKLNYDLKGELKLHQQGQFKLSLIQEKENREKVKDFLTKERKKFLNFIIPKEDILVSTQDIEKYITKDADMDYGLSIWFEDISGHKATPGEIEITE